MKSPAMSEALRPLHRLEAEARKENEAAASAFSINFEAFKLKKDEAAKRARNAIKKGNDDVSGILEIDEPQEPQSRRYILNDATYEALGEVLAANPNGVLTFRDELVSLLKTLDREEYAAARGFFFSPLGAEPLGTRSIASFAGRPISTRRVCLYWEARNPPDWLSTSAARAASAMTA